MGITQSTHENKETNDTYETFYIEDENVVHDEENHKLFIENLSELKASDGKQLENAPDNNSNNILNNNSNNILNNNSNNILNNNSENVIHKNILNTEVKKKILMELLRNEVDNNKLDRDQYEDRLALYKKRIEEQDKKIEAQSKMIESLQSIVDKMDMKISDYETEIDVVRKSCGKYKDLYYESAIKNNNENIKTSIDPAYPSYSSYSSYPSFSYQSYPSFSYQSYPSFSYPSFSYPSFAHKQYAGNSLSDPMMKSPNNPSTQTNESSYKFPSVSFSDPFVSYSYIDPIMQSQTPNKPSNQTTLQTNITSSTEKYTFGDDVCKYVDELTFTMNEENDQYEKLSLSQKIEYDLD
jgi:hypothetical protein